MDFSSFDRDLEELKADVKVREALESGVELTGYASKIQQDLEELVKNSIPDYVREAPETAALNGLSTGPLQTTVERADTVPLVAIAGMLLLAGGIAVLVMDWTDRSV